jgi:arabinose-5-phosphate isomerase
MLALGDALAMSVLKCRDFSPEKYAFYHPGGSLGRALMQVREIMRTGCKNCIVPDTMTTKEVIQRYTATEGRPGAATVVDKNGQLAGIFTDGNLRRCLAKDLSFLEQPISAIMSIHPKTILPDRLVQEALRILSDNKIDQVVVINEVNQPIGLVDIQDLVII